MANWTEVRHRRQVRVAFLKGKPVAREDRETVRKMVDAVRWYLPVAVFCAVAGCLWLYLAVIGPGHERLRWSAFLYVLAMGLLTWTLLRQRRRILAAASTMGWDA